MTGTVCGALYFRTESKMKEKMLKSWVKLDEMGRKHQNVGFCPNEDALDDFHH